jgi:pimeloyl-ACP methyl ester carboxylesterase
MPLDKINGVNLYWELTGSNGDPLVLVHGSWGDHHNWDSVVNELSKTFRVLTYDRRGHSKSERLKETGNTEQDVSDLIALIEFLGLSPAHIAGNSFGAAIVLKTAARQPDIFRSLIVHEPPLFGLLKNIPDAQSALQTVNIQSKAVTDLIEKGENEAAAEKFVETIAIGPGGWMQLPLQLQQTFIYNATTWYEELQDPESLKIDTSKLSKFNKPALISGGTQSPPFFSYVIDIITKAIPGAKRFVFEGEGHVPHFSNPQKYVETVKSFLLDEREE